MIWKSPQRLVFATLVGVALWLTNFAQAHALTLVAPALPAVVAGFTTPFFLAISFLATRRHFSITSSYLAFAGLASFNLVMGPPGAHKLVLALLSAGAYDLVLWLLPGRGLWRLYPGFIVFTAVSLAAYVGAFQMLDLPGKDKLMTGLWAFAAIFLAEGLISTAFAIWFYRRWLLSRDSFRVWAET